MAQLKLGGVAICRWCKEPMDAAGSGPATRPREVHPEHVRARKNAFASRRWTPEMDACLTAADVARLEKVSAPPLPEWLPKADRLQSVLNSCLTQEGEPSAATVRNLLSASAQLLEALRSSP